MFIFINKYYALFIQFVSKQAFVWLNLLAYNKSAIKEKRELVLTVLLWQGLK